MLAEIIPKIAEQERAEKPESKYGHWPSLAGPTRCRRSLVYWGLGGQREPLQGRAVLIFDDSSWHEELTKDWIRKSVYKLHSEQMKIEIMMNDIIIRGKIDGVLTDPDGKEYLLEHKAINHFSFEKIAKGEDIPLDALTQSAIYSRGLQEIQPSLIDLILLIKNKNTAAYLEIICRYDYTNDVLIILSAQTHLGETIEFLQKKFDFIVETAIKKFMEIDKYIAEKILPKRDYDWSDWQCQYCGWGKKCWEDWEKELADMSKDQELNEELKTAAKFYCELGGHEKEIKKQRDEVKQKIKDELIKLKISSGKTDEYSISLAIQHRKEFIIPAQSIEILSIRKLKKE
jgi:hypothetical protein